jgi:hypothetical protein
MIHEKLKNILFELDITADQEERLIGLLSEVYVLEMNNRDLSEKNSELSWYKHPDRMGK